MVCFGARAVPKAHHMVATSLAGVFLSSTTADPLAEALGCKYPKGSPKRRCSVIDLTGFSMVGTTLPTETSFALEDAPAAA